MKKFLLCVVLVIGCLQVSFSQIDNKKIHIKPGIGFGFGIFYPTGINEYIEKDLSNYLTVNESLYMNYFLRGSLGIQFSRNFELKPVIETAIAPKIVFGADKSYLFGRVSPGILANFHIPLGKSRHSVFLGGGVLYHYMWFKDYSGSTIGPAVQGGVSFRIGRFFNPEVYAGFNYAKTEGNYNGTSGHASNLELSYTDFRIGIHLQI